MKDMNIRVYSLAYPVTALGPGNRTVLWVAGCGRGCADCISPEMQPPDAGRAVPVARLAEHILGIYPPLDGITISGGEPFDQAEPLAAFLRIVRPYRPAWTVIAYSGYAIGEIRADPVRMALLAECDVLIDGPYRREIPRIHPLAGSGNQRVHCLTAAGEAMRAAMESCPVEQVNLGFGNGTLDMIIGVTGRETRAAVCEAFHAGAPDANQGQGNGLCGM